MNPFFVSAEPLEVPIQAASASEADGTITQPQLLLKPIAWMDKPGRGVSVGSATAAGTNERLIYSSTLGRFAYAPGANVLIADDISTTAAPGCRLSRYSIDVTGRVDKQLPGTSPYSVTLALYTHCPYSRAASQRASLIVLGSLATVQIADVGRATIEVVIPPEYGPIPNHLWLGVSFSRANAGVILGGLPEEGYSTELFDTSGNACKSNLGPSAPHSMPSYGATAALPHTLATWHIPKPESLPIRIPRPGFSLMIFISPMMVAGWWP
jgi:hypothetical protein